MFVLKIALEHLETVKGMFPDVAINFVPGGEKFCIKADIEMLDKMQEARIVAK